MSEFTVSTDEGIEVVDVTSEVAQEAEPRLIDDIEHAVGELVPDEGWHHDELDGNADAHLRAMVLGEHVTVPVGDGDLALGEWQSILLVDCDGPRRRTVRVLTD